MDLQGKTALVTGANRGIGLAIARELLDRGAHVLAGVREPSGAPGDEVRLDLSSRESIEAGVAGLGERAGEVDILVNNAGVFDGGLFEEIGLDDLYELVQVNVTAPMHLTRALLPALLRRDEALVVNNASIIGAAPFPGAVAYAATKGAVVAFSESLRRELDETTVGVLELITPGIDTDMMEKVQRQLDEHADTSGWDHVEPADWAAKVADAIEAGKDKLHPSTAERLAELLPDALLDLGAKRVFSR
jgi:short-subunit dehydrogenase